jgi:hypothetical protein
MRYAIRGQKRVRGQIDAAPEPGKCLILYPHSKSYGYQTAQVRCADIRTPPREPTGLSVMEALPLIAHMGNQRRRSRKARSTRGRRRG